MIEHDELRPVSVSVTIWVLPDADISEVVSEMDYTFDHEAIKDYEIRDIITEI